MMKMTCENCDYWEKDENSDWYCGECRSEPPRFLRDMVRSPGVRELHPLKVKRACWPITYATEWCGKWFNFSVATESCEVVNNDK